MVPRRCSLPLDCLARGRQIAPAPLHRRRVVRRILNHKCCIEENKQDLPSAQIIQRRLQHHPQASSSEGEGGGRRLQLSRLFLAAASALSYWNSGCIPTVPSMHTVSPCHLPVYVQCGSHPVSQLVLLQNLLKERYCNEEPGEDSSDWPVCTQEASLMTYLTY